VAQPATPSPVDAESQVSRISSPILPDPDHFPVPPAAAPPQPLRFITDAKFDITSVPGRNTGDLGIMDLELASTLNIDLPVAPLKVTPRVAAHLWNVGDAEPFLYSGIFSHPATSGLRFAARRLATHLTLTPRDLRLYRSPSAPSEVLPMSQPSADCRVYERHFCQVRTLCQPAASNETRWDAIIDDISKSGVRLRLRRRFEPRAGLALELPGKEGQEPYTVYVKVVHIRREDGDFWSLGCKLMSELSDEEMQRLTAPKLTVVPEVKLRIGVRKGRVVDCNVKRLHVAGIWPLPPGKALNLSGVAFDGFRLNQEFEVVQCRQQGEGWAVDVQPLDPKATPSWLHSFSRAETN